MNKTNLHLFALAFSLPLLSACGSDSSTNPSPTPASQPLSESSVIDWEEIPQSCDALVDGNNAMIRISFKNWTWTEVNTFKSGIVHTTQTFRGITQQDFNYFCNIEKKMKG